MKKINLIEWLSRNSHEKQSPQRFARYAAMLLLLVMCVTHAWGANSTLTEGSILYCNVTNTTWTGASSSIKFNINKNGSWDKWKGTNISGTNIWYMKVPANVTQAQALRCYNGWTESDNYSILQTVSNRDNNSQNCITVTGTNWGDAASAWATYTPNTKTIHVHVPEGWTTPKLYTWFNNSDNDFQTNGAWPGTNGSGQYGQSISNTSGNWYDVTIAEISTNFIIAKDNDTKTSNLDYFGANAVANGEYYIATANSTLTAVVVPTVTSSAASTVTYSSAVFNGNVTGMGNDPDISSYGFYWSSSSFTTADVSGCAKVDLGSKAATGAFTYTATGLSAETTYYFVSYATNHKGTSYGTVRSFTTEAAPVVPTLTLDAVSPTTLVEGNDVTITTTRSNTSNTITFEYNKNDGKGWQTLTPKSTSNYGQTAVYTIPEAHGATQTYNFRALIEDDDLTTSSSSNVTVYGKKTIKVKNTNGWATFNSYVYDHNGTTTTAKREEWPGSTTGVTSAGGQWKQVVLTSQYKYFILNDGGTSEQLSGETYTYASSVSDGSSYAIGGSGSTCTLSSTSAPTAPTSIVTTAPTGLTNTSVTMNGNIGGNGNDALTEYGFYFGDTPDPSSIKYIAGTTGDFTGAISQTRNSDLVLGKTYHYRAFATNGQGTTYGDNQSFVVPYKVTVTKPTGCSAITPDAGTQYVHIGDEISSTATTGYTFSSWSVTNVTLSSPTTEAGVTTSTISAISADNGTIQPVYTENITTVNLIASPTGKGTFTSGGDPVTSVSAGVATHPTVTAVPATGYRINTSATVWSESSEYISISATNAATTTITATGTTGNTANLTATFTPITYTVHFNGNGATSGEMSDQTGIAYDAATTLTANAFVKTGYTFAGWATSQANADAGTVEYTDGQSVSNLSSTQGATVTLYAVWTPNEYTVRFNANGGTGSMSDQGFAYGVEENLQTNTFTKDGYHFDGWAEAADGDVVYEDGADGCRISSTHGATVTLYAHWTKSVLTDITFAPTSAAGQVRVTATPVITPAPTGTTQICWTMWSNSACTEEVDTASFTATGVNNAVTFWTPDLSGTYYIRAEYKTESSCDGGTELNTIVRTYVVASEHNVTIKYMYDGMEIASRTQEVIPAADSIEITAPDLDGYTFSSWSLGDVILQAGAAPKPALTSSTIEIKALYDGVVIANYSKKDMIYFNNTLGWEHVYVYFYSSDKYWSNTYGTGAKYNENFSYTDDEDVYHADVKPHYQHYWGEMEQIEGTNVWRFDYQAAAASLTPGNTEINGYTNVVFTKDPQGYGYGDGEMGYQWFHNTEAVRRGDFDHGMSMFVPIKENEVEKNGTNYYFNGYWMNYPESSGYTLKVYYNKSGGDAIRSVPFEFNASSKLPSSVTVDLEAKKTYYFEVMSHHVTPKYYGNNGTMTNENNAQEWEFFSSDVSRCGITTTAAGDYKFNWSYANGTHGYQYHMEVDFPATLDDYRIKYTDTEHTGVGTSYARYSRVINKRANGVDTVSFFIATDKTPTFAIEYITGITNEGVVSWSSVEGKSVNTAAVVDSKVYNIRIEQDADGNITSAAVIGAYTGNYYIRTDCASSQWNNYRYDPGNLMTYSEYAKNKAGSDYTHYFMAHANAGTNVKFVVANDYSAYLTDTLYQSLTYKGGDASHVTSSGSLNAEANIRFMWDMRDNKVIRAYLAAAKEDASKFLVLQGTSGNIADENGDPLRNASGNNHGAGDDAIQFIDKENWIYETTVQVVPSSFVKLYALYNGETFYYYGSSGDFDAEHAIQLVTGDGETKQKVKVVYDFKTDRLVAAWQPPVGAIGSPTPINADVMLVRNHQDAGQNIRFTESGALTAVKTVYGVMQFNRWTLNNRDGEDDVDPDHCKSAALIAEYHPLLPANEMKSDYERFNYFISFPFDVKVGDIFGFGTYGRHWVLKYYDGKGRAKNGYWADSESNWKYITNTDSVLHAYQGYLLKLSVSRMAYDNEEVWSNNSSIMELYFPSTGSIGSITQKNETIPALGAEYECTINRGTGTDGDRRVKDSYWRCIGVPSFADYSATLSDGSSTISWTTGSTLPYLYEWIMETNHLQAQSTSTYSFEAMKAYLVQYAGQIIFSNVSAKNSVVARHRDASEITNAEWKLTLTQNEKVVDQAFVRLTDNENVTANFDFDQDLAKELNTGSNLYTLIGYEKAAANCLPLTEQTTIIPVGVVIATDGDYTFAIPEGTEGIGVTLVDNETGIRTSLSALDYTINLSAGTYNDRFVLEISPIQQMPTGVELLNGANGANGVRKVLIDGLLYIVKDGKMFDARGAVVK